MAQNHCNSRPQVPGDLTPSSDFLRHTHGVSFSSGKVLIEKNNKSKEEKKGVSPSVLRTQDLMNTRQALYYRATLNGEGAFHKNEMEVHGDLPRGIQPESRTGLN